MATEDLRLTNIGQFGSVPMPRVKDICATKLIYYIDGQADKLARFCKQHGIVAIPDSKDPSVVYELNPKSLTFSKQKLSKDRTVVEQTYAFDPKVARKLVDHTNVFVTNGQIITGALHYTDYNKMQISIYLYAQITELEHMLRQLLNLYKIKIEDIIKFWWEKAKLSEFYKKRLEEFKQDILEKHTTFSIRDLYLTDLIDLVNHFKILKISRTVQELRNRVMHAKDYVESPEKYSTKTLLKTTSDFSEFFNQVQELFSTKRKIWTLLKLKAKAE